MTPVFAVSAHYRRRKLAGPSRSPRRLLSLVLGCMSMSPFHRGPHASEERLALPRSKSVAFHAGLPSLESRGHPGGWRIGRVAIGLVGFDRRAAIWHAISHIVSATCSMALGFFSCHALSVKNHGAIRNPFSRSGERFFRQKATVPLKFLPLMDRRKMAKLHFSLRYSLSQRP